MTEREQQFLDALNAAAKEANRPGGPGPDYKALVHELAPQFGLLPSRGAEVVLESITGNLGTG